MSPADAQQYIGGMLLLRVTELTVPRTTLLLDTQTWEPANGSGAADSSMGAPDVDP
jgi:hypothetical protein